MASAVCPYPERLGRFLSDWGLFLLFTWVGFPEPSVYCCVVTLILYFSFPQILLLPPNSSVVSMTASACSGCPGACHPTTPSVCWDLTMTIHVLSSESFLVILCGKCNSRSSCVRQSPSPCLAVTIALWVWIGLWRPVCLPPASLCWRKRRLRPCAVRWHHVWHPGCTERMALLMLLCVWWLIGFMCVNLNLGPLQLCLGRSMADTVCAHA